MIARLTYDPFPIREGEVGKTRVRHSPLLLGEGLGVRFAIVLAVSGDECAPARSLAPITGQMSLAVLMISPYN